MSLLNLKPQSSKLVAAFGLAEIVIGISIIAVAFGALFTVALISLRIADDATYKIQAALLLEEGAEAMRFVRDKSTIFATDFPAPATRYLNVTSSVEYGTSCAEPDCPTKNVSLPEPPAANIHQFTRIVKIDSVCRDGSGNITGTCGTTDIDTKKLTFKVFWTNRKGAIKTESLEMYLTNR